ncbi:multidrug effflux MFS transporter [Aquicoccus sp. G2-2]|uniref:multidrug effflux MFS transporter n=1 Tax=Aquicoccus sp. G2-2 TaxID=3092120 RepID=UPI002AE03620|nr:multidrug effflux MFS transporter [Aquicoccus sp. G2-2]MEA1112860.1 multidrug effflux MFS transporter [Aquicoccus sp. G2-2]
MPPPGKPPSLTTLVLLTGLSVLSLNMFLPSLAHVAEEFDADYGLVALSLGGYLAISAVLQIILGPLSDMIGRRPVMLFGIGIFVVASIGTALAGNVWVFLGFRMIQSAISAGMVLSRAVVRDTAPAGEAARLLGIIGTAMALAPLLGPVLGGYLDQWFGWRASFWAFALMGAVMFAVTWVDLRETNHERASSFAVQFRAYPELFRARLFWAYCVLLVFSVGGFYVFLGGAPQVGEEIYGLTPAEVGLGMGATSAGFMLGNYISIRLTRAWGIVRMMALGRWAAILGPLAAMTLIWAGGTHPAVLFGGAMFMGLGNGLTLPGANAGVMSVAPRLAGSASGLSGALTVAGGAALSTIMSALVENAYGAYILLGGLVVSSLIGLAAAIVVGRLEAERAEL